MPAAIGYDGIENEPDARDLGASVRARGGPSDPLPKVGQTNFFPFGIKERKIAVGRTKYLMILKCFTPVGRTSSDALPAFGLLQRVWPEVSLVPNANQPPEPGYPLFSAN